MIVGIQFPEGSSNNSNSDEAIIPKIMENKPIPPAKNRAKMKDIGSPLLFGWATLKSLETLHKGNFAFYQKENFATKKGQRKGWPSLGRNALALASKLSA